jgi:hypothetical protein
MIPVFNRFWSDMKKGDEGLLSHFLLVGPLSPWPRMWRGAHARCMLSLTDWGA